MARAASVVIALLLAVACVAPPADEAAAPSPLDTWNARRIAPDSVELERMALEWWPASFTRDRAYFERVLAPEFVWRKQEHSGADSDRQQFLDWFVADGQCGYSVTWQVQTSHTRVLDSTGIVTQIARTWNDSAPMPISVQNERVLTLVAVRRRGGWTFVEGRPLEYQLDHSAWAWPDPAVSVGPDSPTNPVTAPRTIGFPACRPPDPPPPTFRLPAPGLRLALTVLDSATGAPIRRASAYVELPTSGGVVIDGATADNLGRIVFDRVRSWPVLIGCEPATWSTTIAVLDSAAVMRAARGPLVVRANGTGCDQRPRVRSHGTWTGAYRWGFEHSDLRLCGDTTRRIWVNWSGAAARRFREMQPTRRESVRPGVHVTVIGTLEGPGFYGHLGASTYGLMVDSVVRVRAPRAGDCR